MTKPSPFDRDWTDARAKIDEEARCRVNNSECDGPLQAAHVIYRGVDRIETGPRGGQRFVVNAIDVVPLCRFHHLLYDARQFNLLPYLTISEQAAAVGHIGLERARHRVTGQRA